MRIPCLLALVLLSLPMSLLAQQPSRPMTAQEIKAFIDNAPPGYSFGLEQDTTTESGNAKGAGGRARGDNAKLGVTGTAPGVSLSGGVSGTGGETNATGESSVAGLLKNPLFIGGLACLLVGVFLTYRKNPETGVRGDPKNSVQFFLVGSCLMVAAAVPEWAWWVGGIGFVAYLGFSTWLAITNPVAYAALKKQEQKAVSALDAVVHGVEEASKPKAGEEANRAAALIKHQFIASQVDPKSEDDKVITESIKRSI